MSPSPSHFDPYEVWLGISADQQPADHYRLLGLTPFEQDIRRIEAGAQERIRLVRSHQTGPHGALTRPLLEELSAALHCLLLPESKRTYDEQLRQQGASVPRAKTVPPDKASILEPPVTPPPRASSTAPNSPTDIADAPGENESPAASFPGFVGSLLLMAGAVVLIACGTFAIGRYVLPGLGAPDHHSDGGNRRPREKNPILTAGSTSNSKVRQRSDGGNPVVVMQEGSHDVNLTPVTARLSGHVILKPIGGDEVLDRWSHPGDQASWKFRLLRPGFFELELTYAALDEAGETKMTVSLDEKRLHSFLLTPTGALDEWESRRHTVAVVAGGDHELTLGLDDPVSSEYLVIKRVRLSPADAPEIEPNPQ